MVRFLLDLLLLAMILPFPLVAAAETVTVHFAGTLKNVNPTLSPPFTVGDEVSGSFEFESDAPDEAGSPTLGAYPGPASFEFSFGTYTAAGAGGPQDPSAELFVNTTGAVHDFEARTSSATGPAIGDFAPRTLSISLEDFDATVFASDALPTALDIAAFENPIAAILFTDGTNLENVSAELTSVSLSVPEPGAPFLLAAGALVFAATLGRRSRPSRAKPLLSAPGGLAALVVALLGAAPVGAATVYVANDGLNATGCGATRSTACRSIIAGIEMAAPGDTILVGPGHYGDLDRDGSFDDPGDEAAQIGSGCECMIAIGKPVTLISEAGAAATWLDGSSLVRSVVEITASGVVFGRRGRGFTVTGAAPNLGDGALETAAAAQGVTIAGNVITENGGTGVLLLGSAHLLADNRAHGNTYSGFRIDAPGTALSRNQGSDDASFEVTVADVTFEDDVAIGGVVGFNLIVGTAETTSCIRCSAFGATLSGFRTTGTLVLTGGQVVGNETNGSNCGVALYGADAVLEARGVYWGAAAGPLPDPADVVCIENGATIDNASVEGSAKPRRLRLKPVR